MATVPQSNSGDELFSHVLLVGVEEETVVLKPPKRLRSKSPGAVSNNGTGSSNGSAEEQPRTVQALTAQLKRFWPETPEPLKNAPLFCFPEIQEPGSRQQSTIRARAQFTIILTDDAGKREYGFVRRFGDASSSWPVCLCVISQYPWFAFFRDLTEIAERRYAQSWDSLVAFARPLQMARQLLLNTPSLLTPENLPDRDAASLLGNHRSRPMEMLAVQDFATLITRLGRGKSIILIASMLMERRVAFCSASIEKLSTCVHAALALLSPFSWQHVLIPVLPAKLYGYLEAPMPFIIGVLEALPPSFGIPQLLMPEDQGNAAALGVVVVDLDKGELRNAVLTDHFLLPKAATKQLKNTLDMLISQKQPHGPETGVVFDCWHTWIRATFYRKKENE
eukprot:TRINITY_DN2034_c0_g1_i2.p1 TRINITY_DN2034_c0_g1~~TRINITY_DN2034_c0_g1_i2.p1  ORF type:complete len:416 (+),score=96.49 TRINITY_DN2034_c0_g1_i2:71-1249(+)